MLTWTPTRWRSREAEAAVVARLTFERHSVGKLQKTLTLRMGKNGAGLEGTLQKHLDVQDLPKLLAEGWKMVATSPPDEDGNATILLEKDED